MIDTLDQMVTSFEIEIISHYMKELFTMQRKRQKYEDELQHNINRKKPKQEDIIRRFKQHELNNS